MDVMSCDIIRNNEVRNKEMQGSTYCIRTKGRLVVISKGCRNFPTPELVCILLRFFSSVKKVKDFVSDFEHFQSTVDDSQTCK